MITIIEEQNLGEEFKPVGIRLRADEARLLAKRLLEAADEAEDHGSYSMEVWADVQKMLDIYIRGDYQKPRFASEIQIVTTPPGYIEAGKRLQGGPDENESAS